MREPHDGLADAAPDATRPQPVILTMRELRVLSGLSRGAALPVELDPIRIGPDASADLVLVDAGVEGFALLQCDAEGVCELSVFREDEGDAQPALPPRRLGPGEMFELGPVRLQVCGTDEAWDFELPVRRPVDAQAAQAGRPGVAAPAPRAASRALRIGLPIALLALVLVVAGILWSGRQAVPRKPAPARAAAAPIGRDQLEAVAQRLRARLREAGLPDVAVAVGADQLVLDGAVLPDKQESFERLVTQFRREHRPVRLQLRMGAGNAVPGFAVRVLVGGDLRVVVLADGRQMGVGSVEDGWRLVDVVGACALFVSERSAERAKLCLDRPQKG